MSTSLDRWALVRWACEEVLRHKQEKGRRKRMTHVKITVEEHAAYVAAAAERDTLRKRVAQLEAEKWQRTSIDAAWERALKTTDPDDESAPLRIVLDQGPPTEAGWYFQVDYGGWPEAYIIDRSEVGQEWTKEGRWSRRLDIVVPESEVGE